MSLARKIQSARSIRKVSVYSILYAIPIAAISLIGSCNLPQENSSKNYLITSSGTLLGLSLLVPMVGFPMARRKEKEYRVSLNRAIERYKNNKGNLEEIL